MMARPSDRGRYKYGVCTNRDKDGEGRKCPKCECGEVQKVRAGDDFVCNECKEPLRQVPEPKQGMNVKLMAGIVVAVIVVAGGAVYFFLQKEPKVKSIRLSSGMQELFIGDTDTLKVMNTPVDFTTTYIWTSDNENVAKVDDNGVVTMTGEGKAVVQVTARENAATEDSCIYLVTEREPMESGGEGECKGIINAESISFIETSHDMQLKVGEEKQLHLDYVPKNANEMTTWRSEDINIATVNDFGMVKAVAPGTMTVTAVTNRTGTSTSIAVTVTKSKGRDPITDTRKLDLGFAVYEGSIRNGKPEGNGTMTFKKKSVIPGAKDDFEAQAGEYAIGRWHNGKVNVVTLYQKNGNQVTILQK